jgi:hypothetical protein
MLKIQSHFFPVEFAKSHGWIMHSACMAAKRNKWQIICKIRCPRFRGEEGEEGVRRRRWPACRGCHCHTRICYPFHPCRGHWDSFTKAPCYVWTQTTKQNAIKLLLLRYCKWNISSSSLSTWVKSEHGDEEHIVQPKWCMLLAPPCTQSMEER